MPDPMSATVALVSATKSISEGLSSAFELARKSGIVEVQGQLIELQTKMFDLLAKQSAVVDENTRLREENAELKRDHSVEFQHNAYWIPGDVQWDGPFSQTSWEGEKKLVRLRPGRTASMASEYVWFNFPGKWDGGSDTAKIPSAFIAEHCPQLADEIRQWEASDQNPHRKK